MNDNDPVIPAHKKIDGSDLFWLVYLIFFLIEPVARHSAVLWAETAGYLAAYVGLYLLFLRSCNPRVRGPVLAGMALLGFASYPHNNGGTCFLIYAAALLPFVLSSVPWVFAGLLLEAALLAAEGAWFHISPYSWVSSVLLIGTIGGSNIYVAQKHRADRKLRLKQEEVEALAAVAERERIARDLHDVLGHTLSVIVLKSELAGRLLRRELDQGAPDGGTVERAAAEIADVETTARTALAEVREAIGGYRARGLPAEIEAARRTLVSAGVVLHTEGDLRPAALPAAQETVLSLALREAVTNIVRHAGATECRLRLLCEDGHYRLSVEDNGRAASPLREGNGLRGMRERVETLGGRLLLHKGPGTQLTIELPQHAG